MAYTDPTPADLKARFPEMEEIPDALASAVIEEAAISVGPNWPEHFRRPAHLYLAAHLLAAEGGLDRSATADGKGNITSVSVGGETMTYGPAGGGVVAFQQGDDFTSTAYGRRYAELRRLAFAGSVMTI